ncbi:PREDICTED: UDP-glucuronosyltransferase 1-1-like [Ficedula albicollis]|uniref:UDP-glucuronosyltransferase 1-1-like n=1 Tax=Ficedula albicollis TaxID=59894 RepID=UPI0007AD9522|nr:PREDICTED: UDP-glucuronosyltransferase 1-1-like [Ficedula albicollis]
MAPGLSASPPLVVLLLSLLGLAAAGKLLVMHVDGSPWLSVQEVLETLKQKGHEVVVVAPEVSVHVKPSKNFEMKIYSVPFTKEEFEKDFKAYFRVVFEEGSFIERFFKVFEMTRRVTEYWIHSCEQFLKNKELMRYLEESKFDAVLTDPFLPCGAILAERLSLPAIYFYRLVPCELEFAATQCPSPPSYVPRAFSDNADSMTFFQRVMNLLYDIPDIFLCDFTTKPYSKLASEILQREVTVLSSCSGRLDFVLDYPRPLMPNIIPIGGLNCAQKKHKELPQEIRGFSNDTQCPSPPSYVPRAFSDNADSMTFLQRVMNLLYDIPDIFLCDFAFEPYSKLASEFLQREVTVLDLLRKGSLWLFRLDFVLDYPRPLMPNIIPIGGLNCAQKKHKELPQVGLV